MTVNFLGLAGCLGALDIPSTELVMRRTSNGDNALRDFLDIFNHRLVSLLYRIRKHHRVGLVSTSPGAAGNHIARYLYSLIGMGTPRLQARMNIRDRALLYYAGILARQPRSMVGLKQILSDYFQVEVEIAQFVGKWCDLKKANGPGSANPEVTSDSAATQPCWVHEFGTSTRASRSNLAHLACRTLRVSCRLNGASACYMRSGSFYLKGEFDFNIRLILKAAEIPPVSLDMEPALSWMSWLGPSRTVKVGSNGHGPTPPDENPSIVIDPRHSDSRARRSRVNFSIDCRTASSQELCR